MSKLVKLTKYDVISLSGGDEDDPPVPRIAPSCIASEIDVYFIEQEELGRGGFGRVFLAKPTKLGGELIRSKTKKFWASTPDSVVIKEIATTKTESIATEVYFLSKLAFKHSVRYYGCIENPGEKVYLIMEYFDSIDFHEFLKTKPTLENVMKILTDVAHALDELHSKGIAHRDIKPENILVGRDGIKLIDYGLACDSIEAKGFCRGIVGTTGYIDPNSSSMLDDADWWAFGQTVVNVFLGRTLFNYKTKRYRILTVDELYTLPEQIRKTIWGLTNPYNGPDKRPNAVNILRAFTK